MSEELDDFEKEIFARHELTPSEQKWLDMLNRERQRDWFLERVKVEDANPNISVGGLAVDLGLYVSEEE